MDQQEYRDHLMAMAAIEAAHKRRRRYRVSVDDYDLTDAELVDKIFCHYWGQPLYDDIARTLARQFVGKLRRKVLVEVMDLACTRSKTPRHAALYFCEVAWDRLRS